MIRCDLVDQSTARMLAKLVMALMVFLLASSLLNWAIINQYVGNSLGRLVLYFPLFLGLVLVVTKKPAPGMVWLLVGFTLVVVLTSLHSIGPGSRGFVVASAYFLVLGQLINGFRLQRYAAQLSLLLVVFLAAGLIFEGFFGEEMCCGLSLSSGRSSLFYMNPNLAALALCFLAFSAAVLLTRKAQCLLWVGVIFAVLTTGSRSILLAMFIVFWVWFFFDWRKKLEFLRCNKLIVGGLVGVLVVAAGAAYDASPYFQKAVDRSVSVVSYVGEDFSGYVAEAGEASDVYVDDAGRRLTSRIIRVRLMTRAWNEYLEAPWFGSGVDRAYELAPHNLYVFWPLAVGVLGWVVLPSLLLWLWFSSGSYYVDDDWGAVSASDKNPTRKLLVVFLVVAALFLHDLFMNYSLMVAFSLAVFSNQKELAGAMASDNDD